MWVLTTGTMIDHDRLFKELITTFFWEFIQLFFPEMAAYLEPDSITFLDKELFTDITAGERYETDIVAKGKFRGQEACFLIHIEHQAQEQPILGNECFAISPACLKNTTYQFIPSSFFPTLIPSPQNPMPIK